MVTNRFSRTFLITPTPEFRLDLAVWALRRRPDNVVDRWDETSYRRILVFEDEPAEVRVRQLEPPQTPRLEVSIAGPKVHAETAAAKDAATASLEKLLGLHIDLSGFYRYAARQPLLRDLVRGFHGMKPPRFASVFEALVNGIACQQLTLTQGIHLLNRLAEAYGPAFGPHHAFPRPGDLAGLNPSALRPLGLSLQRARAILEAAEAVAGGGLNLEELDEAPDDAVRAQLMQLRGVGRWTAEYVMLRGLGRLHVFPGDDAGARNNLKRWLRLKDSLDYEGVLRTLGPWRAYGGLIYFHLLLDRLEDAGHLRRAYAKEL